jgi:hypothetical protein
LEVEGAKAKAHLWCMEVTTVEDEDLQRNISERKIEANRNNAQQSTGPKTTQGKRNSSRNATKHGLLSKELVIRSGQAKESAREFQQLFTELIEDLEPHGRTELSLVEFVAICKWRLRRAVKAEKAEIEDATSAGLGLYRVLPPTESMNKILRYQTAIHRQMMQALQLLEKMQLRRENSLRTSTKSESDVEEK